MGNSLFYQGLDILGRRASGETGFRDFPDLEVRYDDNALAGFMAALFGFIFLDPELKIEIEGPDYKERFTLSDHEHNEKKWRRFSAGFSRITRWHLRRLLTFHEVIGPCVAGAAPNEILPAPLFWHPPAEKAEACRELAAACRAWEPGVDMVWRQIMESTAQIYPEDFQKELREVLWVDPVWDEGRNMIDGDLATHLAANLESLVVWIEAAAAAGDTELALVQIDG